MPTLQFPRPPHLIQTRRVLLLVAATLALAACGFQLRGSRAPVDLPFATVLIGLPTSSEFYAALKRGIESSPKTRVIEDPKSAQVVLSITGDAQAKNVLTLDTSGRVSEFELIRTISYRLHDAAGRDWLPPGQVVIRRNFKFSDAQILAKEAEEALLWRDMQNDAAQQLLRRIATAKAPTAN